MGDTYRWGSSSNSSSPDSSPPSSRKKLQVNSKISDLKKQLSQSLKDINGKGSGHFATNGALSSAVNPGLNVHGLGTIGLPLSEREAVELAKSCHQAPFGKGSETIVDTDVRNTWELNADQFELENPESQNVLATAVHQVANALGIVGGSMSVRAELYKLLLYAEGAFFESHTDTEKAPGMFGTLVIALPSKHTGGDVHASFGGQRLALGTAGTSKFGYSYLAWYSDVEHTVRSVTSGHRLVLTYNLIQSTGGPPRLASRLNDDQAKLKQVLALWNHTLEHERNDAPNFLAYMLDHKYTDANLRLDHLKGKDAFLARYLQAACHDQGFRFFLANLEHTKSGGCEDTYDPYDHYGGRRGYNWKSDDDDDESSASNEDGNRSSSGSGLDTYHELEELYDTSLALRTFYRANGQLLAKGIPVKEMDMVQENPFERAPDSEDYEGYTGNAGASATHTYRNSCIVIMPRQHQTAFLLDHATYASKDRYLRDCGVNMEAWLGTEIEDVKANPADHSRRVDLFRTCELIVAACKAVQNEAPSTSISWGEPPSLSDSALGLVARAALQLKRPALFESAAKAVKECLPLEICQPFGELLSQRDTDQGRWQKCLDSVLKRMMKVQQRWKAVTDILQAYKAGQANQSSPLSDVGDEALKSVMRRATETILSVEVMVSNEDAEALVEMIGVYGQVFLFTNVLPFVKKHVSNTSFSITFLVLLFKAERKGTTKDGVANNIYRDVLTDLIPSFTLTMEEHPSKKARYSSHLVPRLDLDHPKISSIDPSAVASLIGNCRNMNLNEEHGALLGQLIVVSKVVDPSAFQPFFIPLLARLVELPRSNNTSLNQAVPNAFFKNISEIYLPRYVGMEPAKPRDWSQSPVACHCSDCHQLSRFLADPTQKTGRFPMAEKRRKHLQYKLPDTGCTYETERWGSPHTLVVTKTLKNWQDSHKAWKARCVTASHSFQIIGTEALQEILGQAYEDIISLKAVKLASPAETSAGPPAHMAPQASIQRIPPAPAPSSTSTILQADKMAARRRRQMANLSKSISRTASATADAMRASRREALATVSQSGSRSNNPGYHVGQQPASASKVDIIDLT